VRCFPHADGRHNTHQTIWVDGILAAAMAAVAGGRSPARCLTSKLLRTDPPLCCELSVADDEKTVTQSFGSPIHRRCPIRFPRSVECEVHLRGKQYCAEIPEKGEECTN
jgi:hypothetical protein